MWNYINKNLIIPILTLVFLFNPLGVIGATNSLGTFNAGDTGLIGISNDVVYLNKLTTSSIGGTLKSATTLVSVSSGSAGSTMVVYGDNGSGDPGTLLATSDAVTVNWTSFTTTNYVFSGQNQINLAPNTSYYIGIHNDDPGVPSFSRGLISSGGSSDYVWGNYNDTYPGAETTFSNEDEFNFTLLNQIIYYESPEGISYPLINPNLYDSGLRLNFDGVDERLTSASNPSYSSDTKSGGRTLCMWFNLNTLPASETNSTLFAWSNSDAQGVWSFRIRNGRASVPWTGARWELQTALDTGAGTGTSTFIYSSAQTFSANTIYHLCLVSSGTAWTLYVNGSSTTLTVSATGSGGNDGDWWGNVAGSGTITFTSGATNGGASLFDGQIDDIAYFLDDLTASEVSLLYNGGKPIHPRAVGLTDLDHYWKLGEAENGAVTTIFDMVGSDNWSGTNMENADIVTTSYY